MEVCIVVDFCIYAPARRVKFLPGRVTVRVLGLVLGLGLGLEAVRSYPLERPIVTLLYTHAPMQLTDDKTRDKDEAC
jgi:hypothetical protein